MSIYMEEDSPTYPKDALLVAFANGAQFSARLLNALLGVQHGSCWCPMGIGHPSFSDHTTACKTAQLAVESARKLQ